MSDQNGSSPLPGGGQIGQQPDPNKTKSSIGTGQVAALISPVVAMVLQQFTTSWLLLGAVALVAVASFIYATWRWEVTAKLNAAAKSALTALILVIGSVVFYPRVQARFIEETVPDDLIASFSFPHPKQIGVGAIDFSAHFTNRGSRLVTIKDIFRVMLHAASELFLRFH